MKKNLFLILYFLIGFVNAQSSKNVENHQISLNILLPGVVYEAGISQNSTLTAELTLGFQYRESTFLEDGFGVYPIGRLQYRDYYNFQRRLGKGKRIEGNSGNYTAPTVVIQSGNAFVGDLDLASRYTVGIGAVYGIQRTAPKGFQFRLEGGPGYFFDEFSNGLGLILAAKIGWVIRKGK